MLRLLGRKTITDKVSSEGQKSIWGLGSGVKAAETFIPASGLGVWVVMSAPSLVETPAGVVFLKLLRPADEAVG